LEQKKKSWESQTPKSMQGEKTISESPPSSSDSDGDSASDGKAHQDLNAKQSNGKAKPYTKPIANEKATSAIEDAAQAEETGGTGRNRLADALPKMLLNMIPIREIVDRVVHKSYTELANLSET
jgi:hypothetical protein